MLAIACPQGLRTTEMLLRCATHPEQEIGDVVTVSGEEIEDASGRSVYTRSLRQELPFFLRRHGVRSLVDAGCGAFSWQAETDLGGIEYIGLDRNRRLIAANAAAFARADRSFHLIDLTVQALPRGDVMLCRDVLNHLSYLDIYRFFQSFLRSNSSLLLVCSHAISNNRDLTEGVRWRQLNLTRPPFNFPPPTEAIADWIEGRPRRHLSCWTREQVVAAIEAAPLGFRKVAASIVPSEPDPPLISEAAVAQRDLELVTIVYRPELLLLQLQARSIGRHLSLDNVRKVHVVLNEDAPDELRALIEAFAADEYGQASDRLRIWSASELMPSQELRGWRKQQTLKLAIARHIQTAKFLVLDAKNHFVRPVNSDTFLDEIGRIRSFWTTQGGSLQNYLINCLRYYGLPVEWSLQAAMPAITPFGLYTQAVVTMMDNIAARENMSFFEFFHTPGRDVTEFFLYFAFLRSRGVDLYRIYNYGPRYAVTLFTRFPNTREMEAKMLGELANPAISVFGLHKNRVAELNAEGRRQLELGWVRAGLFTDVIDASSFYDRLLADISVARPA